MSKDPREARELLEKVMESGKFTRVQVDFIDGEYADNKTLKPDEVYLMPFLRMDFDAHLMVVEKNIKSWSGAAERAGFDRVIAQVESLAKPEEFKGLALDVHSPVAAVQPYLDKLEIVVMMAVEPGFGGQVFDKEVIKKIKRLNDLRKLMKYSYKICVDGGVEKEMLEELEKVGADEVAVGAGRVLSW